MTYYLDDALRDVSNSVLQDWTSQGFGMLRLYPKSLDGDCRLNFWHTAFRTADNSMTHDHPWHLHSRVLRGTLTNVRYVEVDGAMRGAVKYDKYRIRTGEGGGLVAGMEQVFMAPSLVEVVTAGQEYSQLANEIHLSVPSDGALTINRRERVEGEKEAYSLCPADETWTSAEPRPAAEWELDFMLRCLGLRS